jgi:peptide/nickel transport system ATP-binding protein
MTTTFADLYSKQHSLLVGHGLSKDFTLPAGPFNKGRKLHAVSDVSLQIGHGESLGIVGESGCGKSTLGRLLAGLLPPTSGELFFQGERIATDGRALPPHFRRQVQMIFQDPFSSLNPRMRAGEIIAEPLTIHGLARGSDLIDRVSQLMEMVGLSPEQALRYPHEFSGGQRQRIGIARALAVSPSLLIADEPLSALDLSIQAQIINLLLELKERLSLSLLFIAHDLSVVRHLSSSVAVMYLGRIVESGATEDLFNSPRHPYTEALLSALPQINPIEKRKALLLNGDLPDPSAPPPGCPFHTRCPHVRSKRCRTEAPLLAQQGVGRLAACHYSTEIFGPPLPFA